MAVPKSKISKSRRGMRRSHDAIKPINVAFDATTGEPKLSHHMSLSDNHYKGREVITPKAMPEAEAEEAEAKQ